MAAIRFEKAETHKRRDARTDETVAEVDKVNIVTLGSLLLNVRACWAEDFVFSLFDAQIVGTIFFFSQFSFGLPFFFSFVFPFSIESFPSKSEKNKRKSRSSPPPSSSVFFCFFASWHFKNLACDVVRTKSHLIWFAAVRSILCGVFRVRGSQ